MSDPIRSAELLVKNALSDPKTIQDLKDRTEETLKSLGEQAVAQLPKLAPPSAATNDRLWMVIVSSLAGVLVVSCVVLGVGLFENIVKAETILALFTTVVGYLAGLLSPSPLNSGKS